MLLDKGKGRSNVITHTHTLQKADVYGVQCTGSEVEWKKKQREGAVGR